VTQTIDESIARFGQEGWLVQKARENYWVLGPGLFNYKMFLMTYNPFANKFQIVKPPNSDSHYDIAVKILASNRPLGRESDRSSKVSYDISIIKVPSMFPVKIGNLWLNLAAICTLRITAASHNNKLIVTIRWDNAPDDNDESSYQEFEGEEAEELLAEWKKACDIILQR